MGKIKTKKVQLHSKPVKPKSDNTKKNTDKNIANTQSEKDEQPPTLVPIMGENVFKNIKIDNKVLSQKLPDFDARSNVTSKSLKGLNLKKKDKRKIKHEAFMQKIETIKTAKKKARERKKREKTAVVGDMSVMEDALPTLELLMKQGSKTNNQPKSTKVRGVQKEKKRKNQVLSDMSVFKQVLAHPAFKDNPTGTITEHLQNKLQQEEQDMDQ